MITDGVYYSVLRGPSETKEKRREEERGEEKKRGEKNEAWRDRGA